MTEKCDKEFNKVGDPMRRTIVIDCWSALDDKELGRKIEDEIGFLVQIDKLTISRPKYQIEFKKAVSEG